MTGAVSSAIGSTIDAVSGSAWESFIMRVAVAWNLPTSNRTSRVVDAREKHSRSFEAGHVGKTCFAPRGNEASTNSRIVLIGSVQRLGADRERPAAPFV